MKKRLLNPILLLTRFFPPRRNVAVTVAVAAWITSASVAWGQEKPNIVMIMGDDIPSCRAASAHYSKSSCQRTRE